MEARMGSELDQSRDDDDAVALSDILVALLGESTSSGITYGQLMHRFGARSHEMLLVFFTFPLCLPVPIPGVTTSIGIIATLVAGLLAFGREPWLPRRLADRAISEQALKQISSKLLAALRRIERYIHPRWLGLTAPGWRTRVHAYYLVALGLVVMLPVPLPLANMVAALPMLLVSLGLLERDGRCIVAGYVAVVPCAIFYVALIFLGMEGMRQVMAWLT